ncbi:hypothetical protein WA026_010147 [Henosepilachna vigintioctopunctata]|uniref:Uncharacterized protein n=1 Tax=Henosepilachna vigintioctopunctata TaxID=420089 RepID=A0AAW1ULI5_9CUCU
MNSHEILTILMNVFLLKFSVQDNLYIYTDNTIEIGVVIDKKFLEEKSKQLGDPMENIMEIVSNELLKYKSKVNVQYSTDININYRKDLFGIVAIASCENSWRLFEQADNVILPFIAVTDMDCPRLPTGKAISIPLLENGQEIPQLLLDLRTSGTLKWNSLILLHDSSIGGDMVSRVTSCLTKEFTKLSIDPLALSLIKINNNRTKDARIQILEEIAKISTGKLGSQYLVICFKDIVDIVMDAVDTLKLVDADSQWLYIISETNHHKKGYFKVLNKRIKFGSNVAFIYNSTSSDNECEGGVYCNFRILLRGYLSALQEILNDEFNAEDDFSGEEWEAIRPSKSDRRTTLINKLRVR